ncbi:ABC transporter ATP-binding protein [Aerolutibacter ruishenii]|uniref:ABC-2 type transport system ATP-binding protein n=1 Tax=Aerolutibacter ruishenii TaxID=686800 RepID=A0A562LSL1_9GAMM|nr:ABC transporter ATP-binding protein [Lysobacter ruishenii]TWI10620.1 ABC-2 type transport system ATP-binding protein [Lysobacter ruishenii]
MSPAIQTHALTRHFSGQYGVTDLELSVPVGAVYGFLGPNGAGKTTTIRLLLGLLQPERGEILLHGQALTRDRRESLAKVGALVESPSLYPHLTGRQNLDVTRRLLDLPRGRIDETLAITGMRNAADRRVRDYSLGMRQRLAISLALLGQPSLLILDEPGNGLDPAGIQDMRQLLRALANDHGITVFVSSHQLGEVEQIASHVGVLHEGRLRFEGTIEAMRARCHSHLRVQCDNPVRAAGLLMAAGETVGHSGLDQLSISLQARNEAEINRLLVEAGVQVSRLAREHVSLEAFFFDVTRAPATQLQEAFA